MDVAAGYDPTTSSHSNGYRNFKGTSPAPKDHNIGESFVCCGTDRGPRSLVVYPDVSTSHITQPTECLASLYLFEPHKMFGFVPAAPRETSPGPTRFICGSLPITTNLKSKQSKGFGEFFPDTSHSGVLVDGIKSHSGLTLEEIAPLAHVSRRTLHNWLSGGAISARKETHLRELAATVEEIFDSVGGGVRNALLSRQSGKLCAYDLLMSGRFEAAKALATGQRARPEKAGVAKVPPPASDLPERLSLIEDGIHDIDPPKLDRRLSRRLKR